MAGVVTSAISVLVAAPILLSQTSGFQPLVYYFAAVPGGLILHLAAERLGLNTTWEQLGWLLAGPRWRAIVFGPFCFIRDDGRLSLRVARRWLSHPGVHQFFPSDESDDEILDRQRRSVRIAALLIVTGTTLLIALLVALVALAAQATIATQIAGVLAGLLVGNLAAVAMNPALRFAWAVDRSTPETQRHLAVYRLSSHLISGIRPREHDLRLLEKASYPLDRSSEAIAGLLHRYRHALDTDAVDAAGRYLDEMIARCTLYHRELHWAVYGEAAFYYAYFRGDAETARSWIKKSALPPPEFHTEARFKSAVMLAEGRRSEARVLASQGLQSVKPSLFPGIATFDSQYLRALIDGTAGELPAHDPVT